MSISVGRTHSFVTGMEQRCRTSLRQPFRLIAARYGQGVGVVGLGPATASVAVVIAAVSSLLGVAAVSLVGVCQGWIDMVAVAVGSSLPVEVCPSTTVVGGIVGSKMENTGVWEAESVGVAVALIMGALLVGVAGCGGSTVSSVGNGSTAVICGAGCSSTTASRGNVKGAVGDWGSATVAVSGAGCSVTNAVGRMPCSPVTLLSAEMSANLPSVVRVSCLPGRVGKAGFKGGSGGA